MSDVPGCGGWAYAESHGIPTLTYPIPKKGDYAGNGLSDDEVTHQLTEKLQVDYVVLAGYLKVGSDAAFQIANIRVDAVICLSCANCSAMRSSSLSNLSEHTS